MPPPDQTGPVQAPPPAIAPLADWENGDLRRREWAAALRWFEGRNRSVENWMSAALLADRIEDGILTPWADVPEPSTPPAQPTHTAPAGDSGHPGTPDGSPVLGRGLIDAEGDLWRAVEGGYRCGGPLMSRPEVEEWGPGPVREVLVVPLEVGRVLEAVQARVANIHESSAKSGVRPEVWADEDELELIAAVDVLFASEPGRSSTVDAPDGLTSTSAAEGSLTANQPTIGGPDDDEKGTRIVGTLGGAPIPPLDLTDAERKAFAAEVEHREPEPAGASFKATDETLNAEPAPAVVRCSCGAAIVHATPDGYGRDGCDDPVAADHQQLHEALAAAEQRAEAAEDRAITASAERQWELLGDSIDPATIPDQRAKNWADWHPETYCHRCGRRNIWSWYADSAVWNVVHGGGGPIWCPVCFTAEHERVTGQRNSWRLAPADKSHEVGHLVQSEAAMRHERDAARAELAEARAVLARFAGSPDEVKAELARAIEELARWKARAEWAEDRVDAKAWQDLEAERDELQQLFELQWTRTGEATELWRAESPDERALIRPDLGALLKWLMDRAAAARREGAADALDNGAQYVRRVWPDLDPEVAKVLEALAATTRLGHREVPTSGQPEEGEHA